MVNNSNETKFHPWNQTIEHKKDQDKIMALEI